MEKFSLTQFLLSVNGFVYAVFGAFLAVIGLGIICAGSANLGAGRLIGQIPKGGSVVLADAYREIYDLPTEAPVSLGSIWDENIGTRIPDIQFSTAAPAAAATTTGGTQAPGETPAATEIPIAGTPTPDPDAERIAAINQALLEAQSQWNATGDYEALLATIAAIDAQIQPGEVYGLRDLMFTEASEFKTAVEAILPDYEALKLGGANPADPIERLRLAKKLLDECTVVLNFLDTHGLVNHPSRPAAEAGTKSAEQILEIVKAAADASTSTTPDAYWDAVSGPWAGSNWTIVEYDDRIGSCQCAKIRAESPSTVKGVVVEIFAQTLRDHFPDQTGPLVFDKVGQVITFPSAP